jgi:hypothetical protein
VGGCLAAALTHSPRGRELITWGLLHCRKAVPIKVEIFLTIPNLSPCNFLYWPEELHKTCLQDSQQDLRTKVTESPLLLTAHLHPYPFCLISGPLNHLGCFVLATSGLRGLGILNKQDAPPPLSVEFLKWHQFFSSCIMLSLPASPASYSCCFLSY